MMVEVVGVDHVKENIIMMFPEEENIAHQHLVPDQGKIEIPFYI